MTPPVTYFRGAAPVPADRRRVTTVALGVAAALLAGLLLAVAVETLTEETQRSRVRSEGVAVSVTVTGCIGNASGTGITVTGYTCRGSFVLDGRHHEAVLGGSTRRLAVGTTVQGRTLSDDPTILFASSSEPGRSARSLAALPATVLTALVVPVVLLARRRRSAWTRG